MVNRIIITRELFTKRTVREHFKIIQDEARGQMMALSSNDIVQRNTSELLDELLKHSFKPIKLQRSQAALLEDNGDQPLHDSRSVVELIVPFEGDFRLLQLKPQIDAPLDGLPGEINYCDNHIKIAAAGTTTDEIHRKLEDQLNLIEKTLEGINSDATACNRELENMVQQHLDQRRVQIQEHKARVALLPYPLVRDNNPPAVVQVPVHRKHVRIAQSRTAQASDKPEYVLSDEGYEIILDTLSQMGVLFERNPTAYERMKEPDLRLSLLVPLNVLLKTTVAAEAFSFKGKTDICVFHEGNVLFIAECKIWTGSKDFLNTIDQLFGYVTWRDTKTAIIIFNRKKNPQSVTEKITNAAKKYSGFLSEVSISRTGCRRFILQHPRDNQLKTTVTVMVYDLPFVTS